MSTFHKPDRSMVEVLDEQLEAHHDELVEVGVRVYVLQAKGTKGNAAIKHHGYPALAKIRIVPTIQRVAGLGDAEILVDGDRWPDMSPAQRAAVIDHELTHLELVHDDAGVVLDCADRPKLTMRLHDRQFGWFDDVARRHGSASVEVQQAKRLADETGQLYLGAWAAPSSAEPPTRRPSRSPSTSSSPPSSRPRTSPELQRMTAANESAPARPEAPAADAATARRDRVAADVASSTVDVLRRRIEALDLESIRRIIELEGRRPSPRRGALSVLELRLAQLLAEQAELKSQQPAKPRRPGLNPADVRFGEGEVQ